MTNGCTESVVKTRKNLQPHNNENKATCQYYDTMPLFQHYVQWHGNVRIVTHLVSLGVKNNWECCKYSWNALQLENRSEKKWKYRIAETWIK